MRCAFCDEKLPCTCGVYRLAAGANAGTAAARARSIGAPLMAFTRVLADVNREMIDREAAVDLERRLDAKRARA